MTPDEVDSAVASAARELRTTCALARSHFERTQVLLVEYSGVIDIERAKRDKAIERARVLLQRRLKTAQDVYAHKLAQIRRQAGDFADRVPAVSK